MLRNLSFEKLKDIKKKLMELFLPLFDFRMAAFIRALGLMVSVMDKERTHGRSK